MPRRFSKREALAFGWATMKRHFWYFLVVYLIYAFVIYVPQNLVRFTAHPTEAFQVAFLSVVLLGIQISLAILTLVVALGFVRIGLKFCDNERVRPWDLFAASWRQILSYFLATLLAGIVVGLIYLPLGATVLIAVIRGEFRPFSGVLAVIFLPLMVVGMIVTIRLSKYPYFIVDQEAGPIQALKRSWALTRYSTWNLLLFTVLLFFVNAAGFLAFGIGLLATGPATLVAHAFVFRKLQAGEHALGRSH